MTANVSNVEAISIVEELVTIVLNQCCNQQETQTLENDKIQTNNDFNQAISDTDQTINDSNQGNDTNHIVSDQVLHAFATVQLGPSFGLSLINDLESDHDTSDTSSVTSSDSDQEIVNTSLTVSKQDDGEEEEGQSNDGYKYGYPMTLNEIDYRDLPLEEEDKTQHTLSLTAQIIIIGKVRHTTEELTIIESLPNTKPVGEGTVFWSGDRTYLGTLFETLGPVKTPFYSIRVGRNLSGPLPGTEVFVASNDPQLTQYVFTDELLKDKGSDASWKNDHEVPIEFQDVSDDEQEKDLKREGKGKGKGGRGRNNNTPRQRQQQMQNNYSSCYPSLPSSPFPPLFPPPLPYTPLPSHSFSYGSTNNNVISPSNFLPSSFSYSRPPLPPPLPSLSFPPPFFPYQAPDSQYFHNTNTYNNSNQW